MLINFFSLVEKQLNCNQMVDKLVKECSPVKRCDGY